MSLTGIKLLCATKVGIYNDVPAYLTDYTCTVPISGHAEGQVQTPVGDLTESTFNLLVQQAVADKANAETSNVEEFTSGDVYGGRI